MSNLKVVINNRNRLSTTKKLVEDLLDRNTNFIWIIDNDSTYPPLLDWYNKIPKEVSVFKYYNVGHLALFSTGLINSIEEEWCFYTDSDIELNPKMPVDYQQQMLDIAIQLNCKKIGLALSVSDIPDHYRFKQQVLRNEDKWWQEEVSPNIFKADTDTTFSLIKKVDQFQSYRIAGDFTCKHIPWYFNIDNLDEEETYYLNNCEDHLVTQYSKQHKYKKEM
jgi:hypothetical protein